MQRENREPKSPREIWLKLSGIASALRWVYLAVKYGIEK